MISAVIATSALVFLRAVQQLNVVGGHYVAAALTSYLIAFAEIGVVLVVVEHGFAAALWIGTGGAIGVTAAMVGHRFVFSRIAKQEE